MSVVRDQVSGWRGTGRPSLVVLLVVPGVAGVDHVGVDVLAGEQDGRGKG